MYIKSVLHIRIKTSVILNRRLYHNTCNTTFLNCRAGHHEKNKGQAHKTFVCWFADTNVHSLLTFIAVAKEKETDYQVNQPI